MLLHVIAGAGFALAVLLNLLSGPMQQTLDDDEIVFELQDQPRQKDKPRTVIETPDDAITEKPEQADYLSDKDALARNDESADNLNIDAPFSRGQIPYPELPQNAVPPGEQGQPAKESQEQKESKAEEFKEPEPEYYAQSTTSDFRREVLVEKTSRPGARESRQRPRADNQDSRAPDMGALSFNTYDWNFAPYMLDLKRKVERNIFPPPAFTRLGLISGETLLRFKIYPSGQMRDLEILGYDGHKTLMETSRNAIRVSAPFLELPQDFPEEYLEVTAKFSYFTDRMRRQSR